MSRLIVLASAYNSPEKIHGLVKRKGKGIWIYAGKDFDRFKLFESTFDQKLIFVSPALYHDFVDKNRSDFVDWTEKTHLKYGDDLTHWLSATFSSDPYRSNLFLFSMYLGLFQEILGNYSDDDIVFISESHAALIIAKEIVATHNNNEVYNVGFYNGRLKFLYLAFTTPLKGCAYLFILLLRHIITLYLTCYKKDDRKLHNVTVIVDSYILEDSLDKYGDFKNRYFSELHETLNNAGIITAILPVFCGIVLRNYSAILKRIRKSKARFVLPEDYLTVYDYFVTFINALKRFRHFEKVQPFLGIDIQPLVNELNWTNACSPPFIAAMVLYRLPMRLYEAGLSPSLYINWGENQTTHRAFIMGFHKYLPKTEIVGGKPFIAPMNHLNLFGTESERLFGVSPDRVVTCGEKFRDIFSIYDKKGIYEVGASFRYGYLLDLVRERDNCHSKDNEDRTIAVLLPYPIEASRHLITISRKALNNAMAQGWKVLIKPHPAMTKDMAVSLLGEADFENKNIEMTWQDIPTLLLKSFAIVTYESSTAFEAICLGIPVVVMGMTVGLDFNVVYYLPSSMWKVCYTPDSLDEALNEWALKHPVSLNERKKMGSEILYNFFEPNNNSTMRAYTGDLEIDF